MAPVLWLLMSLVCATLGAPSSVPVMQLSAQESSADDPYDDEITILAEPFIPFLQGYSSDSSNVPNVRAGLSQQTSSNYFWPFLPSNTNGLLSNFGHLGTGWQNLQPSTPLTVNVPNTVNGINNQFGNFWNRWQQFLNQAQQNRAQWLASIQNSIGDQYYQYGLPSHPVLYQITHPTGSNNGYFKSMPQPEDSYAPAYQVIAVMPMYNSPPVKVADMLRQRSLSYETQSDETSKTVEPVVPNVEKAVEKEVKKNLKEDLKEVTVFDEKDLKNFASGVAKEVASAVAVAAKNPGKVTEVMVRVDAKTEDEDDSSSSSSSSSEEDTPSTNKKEGDKKVDDDSDSDSSESSDSSDSDSTETSTTPAGKLTTQKQTTPVKNGSEEGGQSNEDSDEMDSVEKIARQSLGSRPVKAELMKPTSTLAKH